MLCRLMAAAPTVLKGNFLSAAHHQQTPVGSSRPLTKTKFVLQESRKLKQSCLTNTHKQFQLHEHSVSMLIISITNILQLSISQQISFNLQATVLRAEYFVSSLHSR